MQDIKTKFYLYCYTLGKEEVFVNLSKDFDTKVVVLKERWNRLEAIGITENFIIASEQNKLISRLKKSKASEKDIQD